MVQHCCFFRMQILGNGINWKEIHSPGIKHFLSHAFSLFLTGQVLEGFFFGTRLENRAHGSETFMFSPFFSSSSNFFFIFSFDEEHEKRCIALGALKQAKWNKKKKRKFNSIGSLAVLPDFGFRGQG